MDPYQGQTSVRARVFRADRRGPGRLGIILAPRVTAATTCLS